MSSLSDEDRANLTAYLDGELDEETALTLEAKLNRDPAARAEVDALRRAWGMLDYLPRPEPSPTFTHRTLERLSLEQRPSTSRSQPVRRRGPWLARVGWAAAVLATLGAGVGVGHLLGRYAGDQPPDQDEAMIRHLRVAEKWRYYEAVVDPEYLRGLDTSDLFGEDAGS